MSRPYTKSGRLADVLALIQVLSLDTDTRRSMEGITEELQGPPTSAYAKEDRSEGNDLRFCLTAIAPLSPRRRPAGDRS